MFRQTWHSLLPNGPRFWRWWKPAGIRFDERSLFQREREWSNFCSSEMVKIPQWKMDHNAVQAKGGNFILPDGKTLHVDAGVSCERLAAIYGDMIKTALLEARDEGAFEKLPKTQNCQLDIEEFDGMWAWPKFEQPGKRNLV